MTSTQQRIERIKRRAKEDFSNGISLETVLSEALTAFAEETKYLRLLFEAIDWAAIELEHERLAEKEYSGVMTVREIDRLEYLQKLVNLRADIISPWPLPPAPSTEKPE